MSYPNVQFVSSPDAAATVRYDFNARDASARTHPLGADGLDLGVPAFTGEPEGVGFDYGYRRIQLTQRIEGTRAVALAKSTLLARELLRSANWLRVQWAPDAPSVYFRTFRGEPGAISLEHADTAGAWDIVVPLVAEGFAYGPRVTIPQVQVVQSPADLAGPTRYAMRYVLPTIKGDAPTPLRVAVTPNSSFGVAGLECSWLVGCVAGKTTMSDLVAEIGTGDGFTAGTGTGAGTANALYFGGSYRLVSIGIGEGVITRLSGSLPTLPLGRYKVMLRCELDGGTANKSYVLQLKTNSSAGDTVFTQPSVTQTIVGAGTARVFRGWVDLGEITTPAGVATFDETPSGQPTPSSSLPPLFDLTIGLGDNTVGGGARLDALKFIPVSGPTVSRTTLLGSLFSRSYYPTVSGTTFSGTWDGDTETYWTAAVSGAASPGVVASGPQFRGSFPYADPAAEQNLLLLMATSIGVSTGATPATGITTVNAQAAVDVSYHPRYLYLGDGT